MNLPQRIRARAAGLPLALICAAALAACGGGSGSGSNSGTPADAPLSADVHALSAQAASPAGRLLASNCYQCHGTNGTGGFEEIRGKSAADLLEFLGKPAASNIMAAHAQGYTPAQLNAIAAYLQR